MEKPKRTRKLTKNFMLSDFTTPVAKRTRSAIKRRNQFSNGTYDHLLKKYINNENARRNIFQNLLDLEFPKSNFTKKNEKLTINNNSEDSNPEKLIILQPIRYKITYGLEFYVDSKISLMIQKCKAIVINIDFGNFYRFSKNGVFASFNIVPRNLNSNFNKISCCLLVINPRSRKSIKRLTQDQNYKESMRTSTLYRFDSKRENNATDVSATQGSSSGEIKFFVNSTHKLATVNNERPKRYVSYLTMKSEKFIPLPIKYTAVNEITLEADKSEIVDTMATACTQSTSKINEKFVEMKTIPLPAPRVPGLENCTFEAYIPMSSNNQPASYLDDPKKVSLAEALRSFLSSLKTATSSPSVTPSTVSISSETTIPEESTSSACDPQLSKCEMTKTKSTNERKPKSAQKTETTPKQQPKRDRKRRESEYDNIPITTSPEVRPRNRRNLKRVIYEELEVDLISTVMPSTCLTKGSNCNSPDFSKRLKQNGNNYSQYNTTCSFLQTSLNHWMNYEKITTLKDDITQTYNLKNATVPLKELYRIPKVEFLKTNVQISDIFPELTICPPD